MNENVLKGLFKMNNNGPIFTLKKLVLFSIVFIIPAMICWTCFFLYQFMEEEPVNHISLRSLELSIRNPRPKIFIIVHVSSVDRFKAIQETWVNNLLRKYPDRITIKTFSSFLSEKVVDLSLRGTLLDFRKLTRVWEWIFENHPDYDWYFKCDDDTYVFADNFMTKVSMFPYDGKPYYFGYPLYSGINYASGGAGYLLNSETLKMMFSEEFHNFRCKKPMFEDMCLGYWLKKFDVHIIDPLGFHPHHEGQMIEWMFYDSYDHTRPLDFEHVSEEMSTYHYIVPSRMERYNDVENRSDLKIPRIVHIPPDIHCDASSLNSWNSDIVVKKYEDLYKDATKLGKKLIKRISDSEFVPSDLMLLAFSYSVLYEEGGTVILHPSACEYIDTIPGWDTYSTTVEKKEMYVVTDNQGMGLLMMMSSVKEGIAVYSLLRDMHVLDHSQISGGVDFVKEEMKRLQNDVGKRVKFFESAEEFINYTERKR